MHSDDEVTNTTWLQLSGHSDTFISTGSNVVWKKRCGEEALIYKLLQDDLMAEIVPSYYGEVEHNFELYIELEDLLQRFEKPTVMDIKMGTRTFLESEVNNPKLRSDLYEKMIKLDINEPSEEEHKIQAITKLHYMEFREKQSSSSDLGFRVEAIKHIGKRLENNFKKTKHVNDLVEIFTNFVSYNKLLCQKLLSRLQTIHDQLLKSLLFPHLELIGTSLLILYDSNLQVGIWIIDFAKAMYLENKILNHIEPWVMGNNEDGYLFGLKNLIAIFQQVLANLEQEGKECYESPSNDI